MSPKITCPDCQGLIYGVNHPPSVLTAFNCACGYHETWVDGAKVEKKEQ